MVSNVITTKCTLQLHHWPVDYARELFKSLNDTVSVPVYNEKFFIYFVFVGGVIGSVHQYADVNSKISLNYQFLNK